MKSSFLNETCIISELRHNFSQYIVQLYEIKMDKFCGSTFWVSYIIYLREAKISAQLYSIYNLLVHRITSIFTLPPQNSSFSWNTNGSMPDVTICYHQTILAYLPCAVALLLAPFQLYTLLTHEKGPPSAWTWSSVLKLVSCIPHSVIMVQ